MNYKPRRISQITKDDSRVSVIGKIVEIGNNFFMLQDDTKAAEVFSDIAAEKDKLVRAYCSVIGGNLKADVIQDLTGFDLELFKKVEGLYNKAGV